MIIKIVYNNLTKEKYYDGSVSLSDILHNEIHSINFPCSGTGRCGKCKVKCEGCLSEPTLREKELLGNLISDGYRLACMTSAIGDCKIMLESNNELKNSAKADFIENNDPITGDNECYAGVVDIGTTGIEAYIYKMPELELVKHTSQRNSQSVFGADVVSRIAYAENYGVQELSSVINEQINTFLTFDNKKVDFRVVTGNTAMLSLYKNIDVSPLASAPFIPNELFGFCCDNECIPKCISAFVGADVTCGIISSGLLDCEHAVLIDIGTNGEIVYKNGSRFICGSAAAGPAFEGANIRNGVQSIDGAINKVYNIGSRVEYTTIGRQKPIGICGSGLIDAVAVMHRLGVIDDTGYLESDFYIGDSGVFITPEDIRNVQTAKAAIRAAVEMICDDIECVEKVFISGSFGSFLNIDSAIAIGLLPQEFKGKTVLSGNTAVSGAQMILADRNMLLLSSEIAQRAETVQLAGNNKFFEKYISYMNF